MINYVGKHVAIDLSLRNMNARSPTVGQRGAFRLFPSENACSSFAVKSSMRISDAGPLWCSAEFSRKLLIFKPIFC